MIDKLRKEYLTILILFVLFPVVGVIVLILLGEKTGFSILFLYGCFYLFYGIKVTNSACPVCSQSFFRRGIFYSCFPKCVHCGAKLFDKSKQQ